MTALFKQVDVKRALQGAAKAGVSVGRVEIGPDGKIVIIVAEPTTEPTTEFDKWKAGRAG